MSTICSEKVEKSTNLSESQLKYFIHTFGCQMNHSDSERLSSVLDSLGYGPTEEAEEADLILFNTCSIKQQAEDRVLGQMKALAKLKDKNPRLVVGITGCMTRITSTKNSKEMDPLLKRLEEVDIVFQIQDMTKLGELLVDVDPDIALSEMGQADLESYFKIQPKYVTPFQAYIPIMTGCDKFCTYCIVPYSRGREKSRPIENIYSEAVELVENGCKEITLLGQNVNSYGLSWNDKKSGLFTYDENPFVTLLKKIDSIPGLKRLRFTSPHPQDMTPDVIETIAYSRTLMPCIHLPLQSGNDEVLRRMNRNYNTAKFMEIVECIRKHMPDCSITTDMIVGFCGETREQHEETLEFFRKVGFDIAYMSQFSPRTGTAADKLMTDNVDRKEKSRRWHEMNDVLRETSRARNDYFLGKEVEVLVERYIPEKDMLTGRTPHFKEVRFKGSKDLIGELVQVKVTKSMDWMLEGELV
jgi:tRNA-2-methylthio-N6-dimethylallyladenosine synthase